MPKSRLSRRVAELEARLGVRLLQRTTRKLSLTEVGELYLRHCVAMRDAAQAAAEAVAQVQTEPRGTMRVACPVTLAQTTVGPRDAAVSGAVPAGARRHAGEQPGGGPGGGRHRRGAARARRRWTTAAAWSSRTWAAPRPCWWPARALLRRQRSRRLARGPGAAGHGGHVGGRRPGHLAAAGPGGAEPSRCCTTPRYVADDLLTLKLAVLRGTGMCLLPDYMCSERTARRPAGAGAAGLGAAARACSTRCSRRAAAWCRRCGGSWIFWARTRAAMGTRWLPTRPY